MKRFALAVVLGFFAAGCVGEAEWNVEPGAGEPAKKDPSAPVQVSGWQELSAGLPASATVASMAHFDGVVYGVAAGELYALPSNTTAWSKVALPLSAGEQVTSVARIDLGIYATTSSGL